jgi:hypothetical protein
MGKLLDDIVFPLYINYYEINLEMCKTQDVRTRQSAAKYVTGRSGPGTFEMLNLRLRPFRASRAQIGEMREF